MKVFYNDFIPFKGFKAINLFGILFARNGSTINDVDLTHESIHTKQMKEMLYIPFYVWYAIEWIVRFIGCGDSRLAYRRISFELEAYLNQYDENYLKNRKHFAWFKHI